jgi:hypothetical protein
MNIANCPFCGSDPACTVRWPETQFYNVETRLLDDDGMVSICAGLGAIVEPYIIAFTNEHFTTVAELDKGIRQKLFEAFDRCLLSGLFPSRSLCIFEHGGSSGNTHSTCVEHCHVHIIDGSYDLRATIQSSFQKIQNVTLTPESSFMAERGYLFAGKYEGQGRVEGVVTPGSNCGSQALRRILAKNVGNHAWNWHLSPTPDAAMRLVESWRCQFPKHSGEIND